MLLSLSSQTHVYLLSFPTTKVEIIKISYTTINFYNHKSLYVTILHEVTELLVADPAVWGAVVVDHPLDLLAGQVAPLAAAQGEPTDELGDEGTL